MFVNTNPHIQTFTHMKLALRGMPQARLLLPFWIVEATCLNFEGHEDCLTIEYSTVWRPNKFVLCGNRQ